MKDPIERAQLLVKAATDYPTGTRYYGCLGKRAEISRKGAAWVCNFGIEVGDDYVYTIDDQKWADLVDPKPEVVNQYSIY